MFLSFLNNLTLLIVAVAGVVTTLFVRLVLVLGTVAFFTSMNKLKGWTFGISLLIVLLAAAKTWYMG